MVQTLIPKKRDNHLTRRQFFAASTAASAAMISCHQSAKPVPKSPDFILKEHGFWDYTTPGAGGMAGFQRQDFMGLLDDMSKAGMNSLCIYVKWLNGLSFAPSIPGSTSRLPGYSLRQQTAP